MKFKDGKQEDEFTAASDKALNAAIKQLYPWLSKFTPREIADHFASQVQCHMATELDYIRGEDTGEDESMGPLVKRYRKQYERIGGVE